MTHPFLFKEYIWLVKTIYDHRRISLSEINRLWVDTDMSGGVEMARSTFNRHKDAIEDIFGIFIDCDRKDGYRYFIGNSEVLEENTVQNWMLTTLSVNSLLSESLSLRSRILLESIPSQSDFLEMVISAMKRGVTLGIRYCRYNASKASEYEAEPYCVKLYNRRWYMLVRLPKNGRMMVLSLDRIERLSLTDNKFSIPNDFDAETYFSECFGIVVGDGTPMERVVVRAFGKENYYLRDLPLHHSQQEIVTTAEYSDFEYHLRPTLDFSGALLSRGAWVKVMSPAWLVEEVKKMYREALERYS